MNKLSRGTNADIFTYVPAGVVFPFAGETPPTGWTICDGSIVSRAEYPELFAALGTAHGEGDGSTTFHLPDMRGRFMRGADAGTGRDPDAVSRAAANVGGATGDNVGSVQNDSTSSSGLSAASNGNHFHLEGGDSVSTEASTSEYHRYGRTNTGVNILRSSGGGGNGVMAPHTSTTGSHSHSVSGTSTETRGINANVNYIIKL